VVELRSRGELLLRAAEEHFGFNEPVQDLDLRGLQHVLSEMVAKIQGLAMHSIGDQLVVGENLLLAAKTLLPLARQALECFSTEILPQRVVELI
jgi:hypothetical protein